MKTTKANIFVVMLAIFVGWFIVAAPWDTSAAGSQVTVVAKSWNNGKVHLWHNVRGDSSTSFVNIAGGQSCTRVDNTTYQIGDGGPPIYYYKLNCNGFVGYVEIDQTR